tara:strand:- start:730 stop:1056 length:327 start_codon:yes stop_codon:yes gene_type:complete
MDEVTIKNYDVLIARLIQIASAVLSSYLLLSVIVFITDKKLIWPLEYYKHILLLDAKPAGLILGWGVLIAVFVISYFKTSGKKVKNSYALRSWLSIKSWVFSLGNDFE